MPCSREDLAGFLDHAFGGAPADQRDVGIARAPQHWRRNRGLDAGNFAHALFHHGAALRRVGEFVADQDAVFIVLVAGSSVGVAGDAGNGARRNAALGDLVAFVDAVAIRSGCGRSVGDQLAAIDDGSEVQILADRR